MILGDPARAAGLGYRASLDDLFRRAATQRPQALVLIDPPNRTTFADSAPLLPTVLSILVMAAALAALPSALTGQKLAGTGWPKTGDFVDAALTARP